MDRYIWYSTPGQQIHPAVKELLSYKAEGLLHYGDLCFAGRRIGTVKAISIGGPRVGKRAMTLLAREMAQIDLIAETPARRPDPPFLVIDEVGPLHSSAPGPTPRFAQLSCLRHQRSR
jgi:hypothetical protein